MENKCKKKYRNVNIAVSFDVSFHVLIRNIIC